MNKILLIDGYNLLFKMYYGIPNSIKHNNIEIKGLVGFLGSLKKLVNTFKPYSVIVIFDSETSRDSNLKIYNKYKEGREDYTYLENNPFMQLPLIYKALKYLDIQYIEVIANEADDYIASFINNNKTYEYIIVSTDTDFIQLIDNNVNMYIMKGKHSILYNEQTVLNHYKISPSKFVLYKALIGDKSDNIDGVKGIGKVIASKILTYDDIDKYIKSNNNIRISKMLLENKEKINRNIKLITLNKNIDTSKVSITPLNNKIYNDKVYNIIYNIFL